MEIDGHVEEKMDSEADIPTKESQSLNRESDDKTCANVNSSKPPILIIITLYQKQKQARNHHLKLYHHYHY